MSSIKTLLGLTVLITALIAITWIASESVGVTANSPVQVQFAEPDGGAEVIATPLESIPIESIAKDGEVRELKLSLRSGATIRGVATYPNGNPAPGLTLWLVAHNGSISRTLLQSNESVDQVLTDIDGRFRMDAVQTGQWLIGPEPALDYDDAPSSTGIVSLAELVEIVEGELEREVYLTIHQGAYIRGFILDPNGVQMSSEIFLTAWSAETGSYLAGISSESGEFAIGPVGPGTYQLRTSVFMTGFRDATPVKTEAGATDVVLQLRLGAALRGEVRDGASGIKTPAKIKLSWTETDTFFSPFGFTSSQDGAFEFKGLAPSEYAIFATNGSNKAGVTRITLADRVDADDVIVRLEPAATLKIFYSGAAEYGQFEVWLDEILLGADGLEQGNEQKLTVLPGRLRVTMNEDGVKSEQFVSIRVGETKELTFKSD
ncbi:MAG: hypothetical protein ACI8TQ_003014 [Planctomycetota bacterium]|jgi:hypothetical protein